jgi:branched-chain amino acid transport system permease protein
VLGTVIFFLARDILGVLTETWLLWYGLMFIVVVMFKPEGLAGIWQDLTRTRVSKSESVDTSLISSARR